MTPIQVVHVAKPDIYVAIADGVVWSIEKNTERRIDPYAIRVTAMEVDPRGKFGVHGGRLYLDGLGLVEVAGWVQRENPARKPMTLYRRVAKLFEGGSGIFYDDTVKAVCRAIGTLRIPAYGEAAHYLAEQLRQHPEEFAELAAAYQHDR